MAGLEPAIGIDKWAPAVNTYASNFGVDSAKVDVLELSNNLELIDGLPDAEFIVGSPPCISFSNSNKSGYADKSLGVSLTEAFFRIVAVKKHEPASKLIGWMMENVPKVKPHLPAFYSFDDLNLSEWAASNGLEPCDIAVDLRNRIQILDSSKLGAPQRRKRLFVLEVGDEPLRVDHLQTESGHTLGAILSKLPRPSLKRRRGAVKDPNYDELAIKATELTDHFYDTGIEYRYWRESRYLKTNHPYMGRMSFPENMDLPARTVVASPFPGSRESMILKCETGRTGDGEYRLPTIREAAVLMSFPLTYQFIGTEGNKWKLVGNAVCPSTAYKIGLAARRAIGLRRPKMRFSTPDLPPDFINLNHSGERAFETATKRRSGARFRRHTFKAGNMTVALANYDLSTKKESELPGWSVFVTYGISSGYVIDRLSPEMANDFRRVVEKHLGEEGREVLNALDGYIESARPRSAEDFQMSYEIGRDYLDPKNPITIIETLREKVQQQINGEFVDVSSIHSIRKNSIPLSQAVSAYALLRTVSDLHKGKEQ